MMSAPHRGACHGHRYRRRCPAPTPALSLPTSPHPAPPVGRPQRGRRPGRGRRRGAAPADRDRPAGRRSRPHRGRPGNRQDTPRPSHRPGARRSRRTGSRARPTSCPSTSRARACTRAGPSASRPGRSSRTSCWSTRSTARRRGPSRRCSRRCRSARSRSRGRPGRCPTRSSSSRPRTRSSSRGRSRCPRPSSTGSWSGSGSATGRGGRADDRPPLPGARRAARRDRAGPRRPRLLALRDDVRRVRVADEVEAYRVAVVRATRSHPDVQLGASPRATVALYRAAQAAAFLAGRAFVLPDDIKAVAPGGPRPSAGRRLRSRACGARHADAALAAILGTVPVPPVVDPLDGRLSTRAPDGAAVIVASRSCSSSRARSSTCPVAIVLLVVVVLARDRPPVWARFGLRGRRATAPARAGPDDVGRGDRRRRSRSGTGSGCRWRGSGRRTRKPGRVVRERPLSIGDGRGGRVLRNAWTLAPFERVTRHFHVSAERRGVYELGPVGLSVGDLFAREAATGAARPSWIGSSSGRGPSTRRLRRRDTSGRPRSGADRPDRGSVAVRRDPRVRAGRLRSGGSIRGRAPVSAGRSSSGSSRHATARCSSRSTSDRRPVEAGRRRRTSSAVESLFVVAASLARSLGLERVGVRPGRGRLPRRRLAGSPGCPFPKDPGQAARAFDLLARAASRSARTRSSDARALDRPVGQARDRPSSSSPAAIRPRTSPTFTGSSGPVARRSSSPAGQTASADAARARRRRIRPERPSRRAVADGGPPRDGPVTP